MKLKLLSLAVLGGLTWAAFKFDAVIHIPESSWGMELGNTSAEPIESGWLFRVPFGNSLYVGSEKVFPMALTPRSVLSQDSLQLNLKMNLWAKVGNKNQFVKNWVRPDDQHEWTRVRKFVDSIWLGQELNGALAELASTDDSSRWQRLNTFLKGELEARGVNLTFSGANRLTISRTTSDTLLNRMHDFMLREATAKHAEQREYADKIVAQADRDSRVYLADARRQADSIIADAELKVHQIYKGAFQGDSRFAEFFHSLQILKSQMDSSGTIVVTPEFDVYHKLKNLR